MNSVNTPEFFEVTIKCLSVSVLRIVSTLLNPTKYIPTKENLPRDWRGFAHLIGCNSEDLSLFERSPDPSFDIWKIWGEQGGSSVKKFLLFLAKLDRYDVYDDIISLVVTDINNHRKKVECSVDTSLFITVNDRNQPAILPKQYDACILYADDDGKFAAEIVLKLERDYKLTIFMKERDLIGGTIEHDATMKIIASRSNRLIIILSPAFLSSSENKYFISFAQSIGIEQRQRKIIPCIFKDCEIPNELKPLFKLDYRRQSTLYNFYEKLYMSIIPLQQTVTRPTEISNNSCPSTVKNTLTVPQISSMSMKEHSSLPELREQSNNDLTENSTALEERSNSISTLESSTLTKTKKPNFKWKGIKKIFKKKKEALAS